MKKTQFIELLASIRETLVSFVSIMIFVALAIAIFLGMTFSSESFRNEVHNTAEKGKLRDFELTFPYGFSDENIAELKEVEGVDEIEGYHYVFADFFCNDVRYSSQICEINKEIDLPFLEEGRLPEKAGEIAIKHLFANETGILIGDTITLVSDNDGSARKLKQLIDFDLDGIDYDNLELSFEDDKAMTTLVTDTYVVTGFIETPLNISTDKSTSTVNPSTLTPVNCIFYVHSDSFDKDAYDGYTTIVIRSERLRPYNTTDPEFARITEEIEEDLRAKGEEICARKNGAIHDKIERIRITIEEKLEEARQMIEDAKAKIKRGKALIVEAKSKIEEAKPQLEEAQGKVDKARVTLKAAENEFYSIKGTYDRTVSISNQAYSDFLDGKDPFEIADDIRNSGIIDELLSLAERYKDKVNKALSDLPKQALAYLDEHGYDVTVQGILDDCRAYIDEYFASAEGKLREARGEIADAQSQIDEGWAQVEEGERQIRDNEKKIADAEKQVKEGEEKYDEGQEKLGEYIEATKAIKDYGCSLFVRNNNITFVVTNNVANIFNSLRYSLAALFLVVGLLVCYSAISRIVNDQIVSIGTKKALGINEKEITTSYLVYTGLSVLLGCLIGAFLGVHVIESVFAPAFMKNFIIDKMELYSDFKVIFAICSLEFVLLLSVTYMACRNILKKNAITLLKGPEPPEGRVRFYEKFYLWKKLSLLSKTIINNCINDKRRVFATLIGVAGCTALIVTALTFKDNVLDSFTTQYAEINHFDQVIQYQDDNKEAERKIEAILDKYGMDSTKLTFSRYILKYPDGSYINVQLFVPDDIESFKRFVTYQPTEQSDADKLYEGIWTFSAYENYFDAKVGDSLTVSSLDGEKVSLPIDGYFTHYLTVAVAYMDPQSFEEAFGRPHTNNAYLISTKGIDVDALRQELNEVEGFSYLNDYYSVTKNSFDVFGSISKVMVGVYLVLSIVMALLVLLNLLTMFVDEKKRELIVLMINGFSLKEARRYIYSDTILLTIIGIIIGCVIGEVMGNISVKSFDSVASMFMRRIDYGACIYGAIGTGVLTFIICNIALAKIKNFKLTDINKV